MTNAISPKLAMLIYIQLTPQLNSPKSQQKPSGADCFTMRFKVMPNRLNREMMGAGQKSQGENTSVRQAPNNSASRAQIC